MNALVNGSETPLIWTTHGILPRADVALGIRFELFGADGISCIVTAKLKATGEIVSESVYTQASGLGALASAHSFGQRTPQ